MTNRYAIVFQGSILGRYATNQARLRALRLLRALILEDVRFSRTVTFEAIDAKALTLVDLT